jgi:hypothetical protein
MDEILSQTPRPFDHVVGAAEPSSRQTMTMTKEHNRGIREEAVPAVQ